jgi:hypothetical protein
VGDLVEARKEDLLDRARERKPVERGLHRGIGAATVIVR